MGWFQGARTRLSLLVGRRAAESRVTEEIGFHIDMETERLMRDAGLSSDEARRRALATFGGVTQHRETLREGRGLAWLGGLSLDVKLALRMLVKHPGLTIVAVLGMSVAVAIGAVSFSAIYTIIDGELPLSEGDRVVGIQNIDTHQRPGTPDASPRSRDVAGGTALHRRAWRLPNCRSQSHHARRPLRVSARRRDDRVGLSDRASAARGGAILP